MSELNWAQVLSAATTRVQELRGAEATLEAVKIAAGLMREQSQAEARRDIAVTAAIKAEEDFEKIKLDTDAKILAAQEYQTKELAELDKVVGLAKAAAEARQAEFEKTAEAKIAELSQQVSDAKADFANTRATITQELTRLEARRAAAWAALDALKKA